MNILALETSGVGGEVALLRDAEIVATRTLAPQERSAQFLAPAIAAVLAEGGWQPRDVELVAVTGGPGSFTGLRVGITTAKTWAYAVGCPVLAVDTLAVIANQVPPSEQLLWAVLDAQRQQFFAALFQFQDGRWRATAATEVIDAERWLATLPSDCLITGSGLKRLLPQLAPDRIVLQELWLPRAITVGRLALADYQAGRRDDLWTLVPQYLRPSAAEEKAATKPS